MQKNTSSVWLSLPLLMLCGLLSVLRLDPAVAQETNKITGTVLDGTIGGPMAGVTVQLLDSSVGTITDIDGKFQINAPKGKTLRF